MRDICDVTDFIYFSLGTEATGLGNDSPRDTVPHMAAHLAGPSKNSRSRDNTQMDQSVDLDNLGILRTPSSSLESLLK